MRRREKLGGQRSYLPALLLTIFFWVVWGWIVWRVDPTVVADFPFKESYLVFFLAGFLAVWFFVSLILADQRQGLLVAFVFAVFGYLRLWKLDNLFNLFLLVLVLLGGEFHLLKNKKIERGDLVD